MQSPKSSYAHCFFLLLACVGLVSCSFSDLNTTGFPCRDDSHCSDGLSCQRTCETCPYKCLSSKPTPDAGSERASEKKPPEPLHESKPEKEPQTELQPEPETEPQTELPPEPQREHSGQGEETPTEPPPGLVPMKKVCDNKGAGCVQFAMTCVGECWFNSMAQHPQSGAMVVGGYFAQRLLVSGSKMYTPLGHSDAFLAQINASGAIVWMKIFGGDLATRSLDQVKDIAIDKAGNIYVLAEFVGNLTLDSQRTEGKGSSGILVAKFSARGTLLWKHIFDGYSHDAAQSLQLDPKGALYVLGSYTSRIAIGTIALASIGTKDLFVAKINTSGQIQWALNLGSKYQDEAQGMLLRRDELWVLGRGFDSLPVLLGNQLYGQSSRTQKRLLIAKISTAGAVLSATFTDGEKGTIVNAELKESPTGDVFIAGYMKGKNDLFGKTCGQEGSQDSRLFVAKLNEQINAQWCRSTLSGADQELSVLLPYSVEKVLLVGSFRSSAKVSDALQVSSTGGIDFMLASIDEKGQWLSASRGGGPINDKIQTALLNTQGQLVLGGFAIGKTTFGDFPIEFPSNTLFLWTRPLP